MGTKKGREFEKETSRLGLYGRRIARSGAYGTTDGYPQMVGDVQYRFPWMDGEVIAIECKHGYSEKGQERKSMRIERAWFDKHEKQTRALDLLPAWAMKFKFTTENGMSKFFIIPFSTARVIMKHMEDVYLELEELRQEKYERNRT